MLYLAVVLAVSPLRVAPVQIEAPERPAGSVLNHEEALYAALVSFYTSLKPHEIDQLNMFERTDARQALKHLGAQFISQYPKSAHVPEVKLNIARACYEDGEYAESARAYRDFALAYPAHPDAVSAAQLALSSLRELNDLKGLEELALAFTQSKLPEAFRAEVQHNLKELPAELPELPEGDVLEGLLKIATDNAGTPRGESALANAYKLQREKRDFRQAEALASRLVQEYPQSPHTWNAQLEVARHAAEAGRYEDAARGYASAATRVNDPSLKVTGLLAAAQLRSALGAYDRAVEQLEAARLIAGPRAAEVLALLARASLNQAQPQRARSYAREALALEPANASAAAVLAEVIASTPGAKSDELVPTVTALLASPGVGGDDAAKATWLLGELMYRELLAVPDAQLEAKVAALQRTQAVFTQAASLSSAEWSVQSVWRVACGIQQVAKAVAAVAPKERAALDAQAEKAFAACADRADKLELFTPAAAACRQRSTTLPTLVRAAPTPRSLDASALQRAAEEKADAASSEALGLALLGAWHLKEAQLALGQAIELDDARASAHSALGLAYLLDGKTVEAGAEYVRALTVDPFNLKARANLAGLRCRAGDRDGARRELALVKDGVAAGADLDPEWRACR